MIRDVQDLRDRAGEYLRQGIDSIRTAAGFIFRDDEKHLSRYPNLNSVRKRRKTDAPKRVANAIERSEQGAGTATSASVVTGQAV